MARALIIGAKEKIEIGRVVQHARANRIDLDTLKESIKNPELSCGNDPGFVCLIPKGFRCVYSIEDQPNHKAYHHLSVSVSKRKHLPNPLAMQLIMSEFRMPLKLVATGSRFWIEDLEHGQAAINVLQEFESNSTN